MFEEICMNLDVHRMSHYCELIMRVWLQILIIFIDSFILGSILSKMMCLSFARSLLLCLTILLTKQLQTSAATESELYSTILLV